MTKKDLLLVALIGGLVGLLIQPVLVNVQAVGTLGSFFGLTDDLLRLAVFLFFLVFAPLALAVANLIRPYVPVLYQFAKFGAVGTLNSFIDLGVLNVLNLVSGIPADKLSNLMFGTFKTISFLLATTNSYLWNKNWTFGNQGRSQAATVFKFYAITALNWVLNVGVATGVKALGPAFGTAELWVNVVAPLAGIFAGLLGNFLGYKYLVFKKEEPEVSL